MWIEWLNSLSHKIWCNMSFSFVGTIPASKSLMNRALIVQSLFPNLKINGDSNCDDIQRMKECVGKLWEDGDSKEFYCGHAGTVLRFLAPRVAKDKGRFVLKGSKRLMSRPQQPLVALLGQLGAICTLSEDAMTVQSDGWHFMGDAIHLNSPDSSQFASGLLLSSWDLPKDIYISLPKNMKSMSYLDMTIQLLSSMGMEIKVNENELFIRKGQKPNVDEVLIEPDYSSLFAVAVCAALFGEGKFTSLPEQSLQPDSDFQTIFDQMNIPYKNEPGVLTVKKADSIKSIKLDINNTPDLLPVLSVLCAFADGTSKMFGAPHLRFKESDRIKKTHELLELSGIKSEMLDDGLIVHGGGELTKNSFEFDPDDDHRMAMAAGLLKKAGVDIKILTPEVVNKSFPEFFDVIGVEP